MITDSDPQTYRLPRDKAVDLEFDGWLLANESSRMDRPSASSPVEWNTSTGRARWTEVRIYRTASDKYVVEIIGASVVPGDKNLHTVRVCDTAAEVPAALQVGRNKDLMNAAIDALSDAALKDPTLAAGLVERI